MKRDFSRSAFVLVSEVSRAVDIGKVGYVRLSEVVLKDGKHYIATGEAGDYWGLARDHLHDDQDPFVELTLYQKDGLLKTWSALASQALQRMRR